MKQKLLCLLVVVRLGCQGDAEVRLRCLWNGDEDNHHLLRLEKV
jgi:hypothetical protein